MTNLLIHITTHHLSLSDSLRRFLRKKIGPVTRFANDTIAAEIGLRRHGGAQTRFSASGRLSLPGQDVRGHAVAPDLYTAIGKLVAKLGRLLRKRKTRLAKVYKHPGRREITPSDVALRFLEEPSDSPKVSRSSRIPETQNYLPSGAFSSIGCG